MDPATPVIAFITRATMSLISVSPKGLGRETPAEEEEEEDPVLPLLLPAVTVHCRTFEQTLSAPGNQVGLTPLQPDSLRAGTHVCVRQPPVVSVDRF